MSKKWDNVDITKLNSLDFNFFTEDTYHCEIYFVDADENESERIELSQKAIDFGATCNEMSIPLTKFKNKKCNFKQTRLLSFVGGEDNSFYLSKIVLK